MPKPSLTFIDQEAVKKDFKTHLVDDSNKRILFSARFGAGKSTFLKHFFEDEEIAKSYLTLKLYPVNYSIAHNKDVFELVKYDIIYELLSKYSDKIDLKKDDYSNLLLGQMFLLHGFKIDPLIKSVLKITNPESELYSEITDKLLEIFKQYSAYKDEVVKDNSRMLMQYIKQLRHHKGSPHEYDDISELITTMLENIAKVEADKGVDNESEVDVKVGEGGDEKTLQTVLIIDDLDRLDPEHVFRLFNIFSAHYDSIYDENKFGFDKVVFVCDYNNIRLMYEHRYGKGVDFSGYIDKFYSTKPFYYDNKIYVRSLLLTIFKNKPIILPPKRSDELQPGRSVFYSAFEYLINALFEVGAITLRNLEQFESYDLPTYKIIAGKQSHQYFASDFPFLILIHLLKKLINMESLKHNLLNLTERFNHNPNFVITDSSQERIENYLIGSSLHFIIEPDKIFNYDRVESGNENGVIELNGKLLHYRLVYNSSREIRGASLNFINSAKEDKTYNPNIFEFLFDALVKSETFTLID